MLGNQNLTFSLNEIIIHVEQLGLPQQDLHIAKEYVYHNEFALSLEHIIEQLFEFDIQINEATYNAIILAGRMIGMGENKFIVLKRLITL